MDTQTGPEITDIIGRFPYRMALAGGWIDQPFVSRHNPTPPGSMVVVGLEPTCRFMDRCGMGTSTRNIAMKLWDGVLPDRDRAELVRELYAAENAGKAEPSGSQDMAGLIYPGISRLDYDFEHEGGYFPVHTETNTNPEVVQWLESIFYMVPVAPRPPRLQPARREESRSGLDQTPGTNGSGVFRRHRHQGYCCAGRFAERLHDLLGSHSAPYGQAPDHHRRPDGAFTLLPGTLSRRDVFGLWGRIPVCCIRRASARRISHQG